MNPRSLYNKKEEFSTFMTQEEIDLAFISESWEQENETLEDIIDLEDFQIISSLYQRKGRGGRPAIIANKQKFDVLNLTNTLVQVPWGVEAVWAILTPHNVSHDSKIQKIACCAFYYRSKSRNQSQLLDHIAEAYNIISTKYSRGLHFIISGDANHLNLNPILSLSPRLRQIVQDSTRLNPPAILDVIMTTLSHLYQTPVCLAPLDADDSSCGEPSDHRIPVAKPINIIENKCSRQERVIKSRPITEVGLKKFQEWIIDEQWSDVYLEESAHVKAKLFQDLLLSKVDEYFPERTLKLKSDDQPWISFQLKKLDRRRKRVYRKERRSSKWKKLDSEFKKEVKLAKENFYKKSIEDLKQKKPGQWYECLKKISNYDQFKKTEPQCEEISHLPDDQQVEKIAEKFASIQNEYDAINEGEILIPPFSKNDVPQFRPSQVWFALSRINTNKSTVAGDVPAKLLRRFAAYLAEPLTDIFNTSLLKGQYPDVYKFEICTPVPKVYPTQKLSQLRNISGLLNFDKIFEKLIAQLMIDDMKAQLDQAQFGNVKGLGIQHYLVQLVHRVLTALDGSSKGQPSAVLATLIDWENAFPRQCPTLGIKSFIENGVRPSLIPLLMNYFKDRKMSVKWHGQRSASKHVKGGGPQGATLGLLEYTSQSNHNADCVNQANRFKFIDDLSILEIISLLTIGIAAHNSRLQVPNDVPIHNQVIPAVNLKSQSWLNQIDEWTEKQKMVINTKKTETMIFNFTEDFQFTTRLKLKGQNINEIENKKLLGTIVSNNLKWDMNTNDLVKRANARMQLLRKVAGFGASKDDLKLLYIQFVRNILEQSAVVWHSSITVENKESLERIQKSAVRIIMGNEYKNYEDSLNRLDLQSLEDRREMLCLKFAQKCVKNERLMHMFPLNEKEHEMKTRKKEKFKVQFAHTSRLKKSPLIYMQKLLNEDESRKKKF